MNNITLLVCIVLASLFVKSQCIVNEPYIVNYDNYNNTDYYLVTGIEQFTDAKNSCDTFEGSVAYPYDINEFNLLTNLCDNFNCRVNECTIISNDTKTLQNVNCASVVDAFVCKIPTYNYTNFNEPNNKNPVFNNDTIIITSIILAFTLVLIIIISCISCKRTQRHQHDNQQLPIVRRPSPRTTEMALMSVYAARNEPIAIIKVTKLSN
jgi:hypothetical protein